MSWDSLEVGLAGGEETVNFGPRNETGSALYQVDTLASISPRDKVEELPRFFGAASQDGFCFVVSKHVRLFNPSCTVLQATLNFDYEVDTVSWSDDSLFVAIGERSGTFHFVHVPSKQILFSEKLIQDIDQESTDDTVFLETKFTSEDQEGGYSLVLLTVSGLLFQFSHLKLTALNKAIQSQDLSQMKELREVMTMKCTDLLIGQNEKQLRGLTLSSYMGTQAFITYGINCKLTVWGRDIMSCNSADVVLIESVDSSRMLGAGIIRVCCTNDGNFLVILDEKNTLSLWNCESLSLLACWSHISVEDFLLVSTSGIQPTDDRSEEENKIVILSKPTHIQCKQYLQVYKLPSMIQTYSLQVSGCHIAQSPSSQDTIFFIEAITDSYHDTAALGIRCLTEALPENRLYRLLHKQQFDEAEKFARQFNLDEELVFKVKVNTLLDKYSLWSSDQKECNVNQLKDCFSNIKEDEYVVNCCLEAVIPTLDDTYDILTYAKNRVLAKAAPTVKSLSPSHRLLNKVLKVRDRLGTFEMAYGVAHFSGPRWHSFRNADLFDEVLKCLEHGEIHSAIIIWARHQSQFEDIINVSKLDALLTSIPHDLRSALLLPWLQNDLVPFVLRKLSEGTDVLALWLEQRARGMELSEKSGWPNNALEMASILEAPSMIQVVKQESQEVPQQKNQLSGVARLSMLVRYLRALLDLHNKYNCPISLAEYNQETTRTLVFRLLDSVKVAELIVPAMTKYIGPYITHHSLDRDTVLLDYIKNLYSRHRGSSYSSLSSTLREARVVEVISCIKDKELHCQATLEVMSNSVVPWSNVAERLVQEVMAANPTNLYLKEQCRFVELKKVLSRYGMKTTSIPDANIARRIVRIILTRDEPTALQDALQVVKAYSHLTSADAYVFRLRKLCREDRAAECVELLQSLPSQEAGQYTDEVITYLCGTLDEELYAELDSETEQMTATRTAITLLKFVLKHDLPTYHEVEDILSALQDISCLQKEFSEFMSLAKYDDPDERNALFQNYLKMYITTRQSSPKTKGDTSLQEDTKGKDSNITLTRLKRLCTLLRIPSNELTSQLAFNALACGNVYSTLEMCRELLEYSPCPSSASVVFKVVQAVFGRMVEPMSLVSDSNSNTPELVLTQRLHQLLCICATCCDPDLLCDCIELCKCTMIADEVYSQCETGDYGFTVDNNSSKRDPLSTLIFGKRFKEEGLVLDSSLALPLTGKFTSAAVPAGKSRGSIRLPLNQTRIAGQIASDDSDAIMQVSAAGLNIMKYLQENSLYKLALRYALETIGMCLQHYAANSYLLGKDSTSPVHLETQREQLGTIVKMGAHINLELTGGLLVKVFNCKSVDHDLGLGYLSSIPSQLALTKLTSKTFFRGQNYSQIMAFANVGENFAILEGDTVLREICGDLARNAMWGEKLSKMKIYIKDVYGVQNEEIRQLLPNVIQDKATTVEMIQDFCRSFNVDEDEALLHFVQMLLLPTETLTPGRTTRAIPDKNTGTVLEYEIKVPEVAPLISPEPLLKLLLEIVTKVDQYDYERILFILDLTKEYASGEIAAVDKGIKLLKYLFHYERKTLPSKYEKTFITTTAEDKDKIGLTSEKPLSPLSRKRLPFHPLLYGDPWKVICAELSKDSIPNLLGIAKLLKLSPDKMYLAAVQNLFTSPPSRRSSSDVLDSCLEIPPADTPDSVQRFDIEEARALLFTVKQKQAAVAAAKWIAQQLPLGEEKVKVLQICVELANEWKTASTTPEDSKQATWTYTRLLELSRGVATEHVLHKYGIAEQGLMPLVTQPAKLVCQLYDTYGARDPANRNQPPDIHKASDEIARIHNSNIDKIRLYLLEKWLPATPTSSSMNDSSDQLSISEDETNENSEDAMNLKRVIYLLQYSPVDSIMFLLSYAYKQTTSATVTSLCRLRALRALFSIGQDETIERVGKKPVQSIRQYMRSLVFLAELEALHSSQSLSVFQKCNKEGLVRGLWRNHNHEKRGVRLVAELSLEYSIYDPQLWNSVLQQLLTFNMIKYLRRVLVHLAGMPDLWQLPCLPHIWRKVLLAPFVNVSPPLSEDELSSCNDSVMLLQRCPLLLDLDIIPIASHFQRVGLHVHGLACIMLLPNTTERRKQIKVLLDARPVVEILDQLQQQRTLLQTDIIENEVFGYIESSNQHELLVGSIHFERLYRYLITNDTIHVLLLKTIQAGRLENAVQLVRLYHSVHPSSPSAIFSQGSSDLTAYEELWAFLEISNLLAQALPYLPSPPAENDDEEEEPVRDDDSFMSNDAFR